MYFTYVVNFIYYILRGFFVTANNLYCIPTYVVWVFLLSPLRLFSEEIYWKIEGQLFYWLLTVVGCWSYTAGYDILETGDAIENIIEQECMVLVNHQSTSDVPLLMAAFSTRNHLLQNLNWIMDGVFKYTNFGVVSVLHQDFFIAAGRDKRDVTLEYLKTYLKEVYLTRHRKWIVLFPEGGFLRKRREAGHRYARKMNLPLLNNVTLPRLGAIQTIMDTIGPNAREIGPEYASSKLKYVVDMTIAYPDGEPLDLGSIVFGYNDACDIRMHYRIFPIENVPHEPEKLQEWVYDRYIEKEYLLDYYYKTGVWEPRVIELSQKTGRSLPESAQDDDGMAEVVDGLPAELQSVPYVRRRGGPLGANDVSQMNGSESSVDSRFSLISGSSYGNSSHATPQETQTESEASLPLGDHTGSNNSTLVGESRNDAIDSIYNGSQGNEAILSGRDMSLDSIIRAVSRIGNSRQEIPRKNHQDVIRVGLVHIVFILSTAFHVYGGYYIYTLFNSKWVS